MEPSLRDLVRRRAAYACEYCSLPQAATPLVSFHIDHIVPRQHGGSEAADTLALACDRCNAYKGPNLTSIDPATHAAVALFNPRQDIWSDHFALHEGCISGLTPKGRATVRLLNMNAPRRVELRLAWFGPR